MPSPRELDAALEADPACAAALRHNRRTWDDYRRRDPELARIDLSIAMVGKVLAVDEPSTPQYEAAAQADRDLRDERLRVLRARAEAARLDAARKLAEAEARR